MSTVRRTPAPPPGDLQDMPKFPKNAKKELRNTQLRKNLRHATTTIREKRSKVVAELPHWEQLRQAG